MNEINEKMIFKNTDKKLITNLFGKNPTLLPTSKIKDIHLPKPNKPLIKNN